MSRILLIGGLFLEGVLSAAFLGEQAGLFKWISGALLGSLGSLPDAYSVASDWFLHDARGPAAIGTDDMRLD
jgi:hypothetical protein